MRNKVILPTKSIHESLLTLMLPNRFLFTTKYYFTKCNATIPNEVQGEHYK